MMMKVSFLSGRFIYILYLYKKKTLNVITFRKIVNSFIGTTKFIRFIKYGNIRFANGFDSLLAVEF